MCKKQKIAGYIQDLWRTSGYIQVWRGSGALVIKELQDWVLRVKYAEFHFLYSLCLTFATGNIPIVLVPNTFLFLWMKSNNIIVCVGPLSLWTMWKEDLK